METSQGSSDCNFKLVVVGDGAVGKTSMLISYTMNRFPTEYIPSVFDQYRINLFDVDGNTVVLDLWDTAGQGGYDRLRHLTYKCPQTDVVLLSFSVINKFSFQNIKSRWLTEIKEHCPSAKIVLVGTKIDLRTNISSVELTNKGKSIVTREEAETLAKEIGAFKYVECSALTGEGLSEVFDTAVSSLVAKKESSCSIM